MGIPEKVVVAPQDAVAMVNLLLAGYRGTIDTSSKETRELRVMSAGGLKSLMHRAIKVNYSWGCVSLSTVMNIH